jgi:hypothetical protein
VEGGASAVFEPVLRSLLCLFAAGHGSHLRGLAPAVRKSEGPRSSMASPICGSGVSGEPPPSPVGGTIRAWGRTRPGAGERAGQRCAVGGIAARHGAQRRRPARHGMAGASPSISGPQVRNCAQRGTSDSTRALRIVLRGPGAGGDPENSADRRRHHEGTDTARRSGADARAVSPHRHSCLCAHPDVGIPAAGRTPDRALSGGHSLGGGRCAP